MKVRDKLILKNDLCRIDRQVSIKRINKDSIVFDYGEESNFDIKYSLKTGRPIDQVPAWYDFKISTVDLDTLKSLENIEKVILSDEKETSAT